MIDNRATGRRESLPGDTRFCEVDVAERDVVAEVFGRERPEFVCHYAAQASVTKSLEELGFDARTNLVSGLNVVQ